MEAEAVLEPVLDPEADYDALREAYARLEEMLTLPDTMLFAAAPSVSAWSLAQQVWHAAASAGRMLRVIEALHGEGLATSEEGTLSPAGRIVLARGSMPRGKAQAPEVVRPPEVLTRQDLAVSLLRARRKVDDVAALLPVLPERPRRLVHPAFGMLTAIQWLRLTRIHTEHHLGIIRDIRASLSAS